MKRVAAIAVLALVGTAPATAAGQTPSPLLAVAQLQGAFQLAGRVTVAGRISGERTGQRVFRRWVFSGSCAVGQCQTVTLARHRSPALTDTLTLERQAPAYYVGYGSFFAPLRCATRTYPSGERVPFTITVRITGAGSQNGTVTATRIAASYTNRYRVNLTPCVGVLGHDAAAYYGHLVSAAPSRR